MTFDEWENILKLDGGRDFRKEQFKGAAAVDTVCSQATETEPVSLLLEAPTGTGKTLIYLGVLRTYYPDDASEASPSDDSEIKAIVSTSGKLLQHQIAEAAKKLGMVPIVLMGRANYLCRTACFHYLETMPKDHKLHGELELLCQWLEIAERHEIREILKLEKWSGPFREFMHHHLTASSAYCRNGHDGNTKDGCYFTELEARAVKNPLVILNHHALFSFGVSDLFKGRILIADEAHAMPEAASSVLTRSVSTRQLYALRARTEQCREACPEEVDAFQKMLDLLSKRLQDNAGDSIVVLPAEKWLSFCRSNIAGLRPEPFNAETIRNCDPFHVGLLKELNASCREIYDFITALDPAKAGKSVLYFETDADGEVTLKYAPIETAPLLEDFWKQWSGTVGLSATLTIPGAEKGKEFDYFRQRCGFPVPTMDPLILPSPFDLQKQCMVFVPASGTDYDCRAEKDPEKFLKKRIELAGSLIHAFGGRTLALHTATTRLSATAAVLKPLFPDRILAQGDGDNDELADEFIREPGKSLLGTRTFFQGFDAPGETLSCEILEKLPFRRRDDPVQEEQCRRAGENWFDTVVLPAMLMELRQAFGRLIRSKDDHGIFILTDHRSLVKTYRQAVSQALGGVPVWQFTGPAELLAQITKGFLPFALADISDFEEHFQAEWNRFRETALFRRTTGLKSLVDIQKKLKIDKLYDWQKTVINNVLNGVPAQFVIQPAGSGKSLTYQLPALMRSGLTLVVSPLKALMLDQVMSLKNRGVSGADFYNSDLSAAECSQILERLDRGNIQLLYVAPERLHCNFINKVLNLKQGLSMLVIDEAHMISEAGSQWRPFYGELKQAWEQFGRPQLLAVSATAGKIIKEDIQKQFEIPDEYVFERSVVRERVKISVKKVSVVNEQKEFALDFVRRANGKPVLIYCSQINYVHDLCTFLRKNGVLALPYYTGKDKANACIPPEKLEAIHKTFLNNKIPVLVATNAYGMGIDKPDIWGVLFNNIPSSLEELIQGWGRICRNTEKLLEYEKENNPPEIAITFNMKDVNEQLLWKIHKPFQEIEAAINQILADMTSAFHAQAQINFSKLCKSCFDETLDEDIQRACILLARFMRNRGILKNSSFDWRCSEFHFSGISGIPNDVEVKRWLDQEEHTRRKQLISVLSFADDKGCRNEFLQTYFSGSNSNRKCCYCDHCGYDLKAHLAYVREIQGATENNISMFERGVFSGDNAAFLQYLRGIIEDELSARIAYLDREHRESRLEHSDAELAARLLEMKQNKDKSELIIEQFAKFFESGFARLRNRGSQDLLVPFARACGIPQPDRLWKTVADLHDFICKNRESAAPDRVTCEFLLKCRDLKQNMIKNIENTTYRESLEKWIVKSTSSELGEFILKSEFSACVYYICRGLALGKLLNANKDEETWSTFAKYLHKIIKLKKEDKIKFRYLCTLIETLPAKEKEEWNLILIAPEDYLKIAEAAPECFGAEKHWEPDWFSSSVLAQSQTQRCLVNRENIILDELVRAAGNMPISSWRDLQEWTPCTAKLYPEWQEMLEKLAEKDLRPDFSAEVPAELADCYRKLPYAAADFLKRKIFFVTSEMQQTSLQKKSKKVLKDLASLNMDFIYPGKK